VIDLVSSRSLRAGVHCKRNTTALNSRTRKSVELEKFLPPREHSFAWSFIFGPCKKFQLDNFKVSLVFLVHCLHGYILPIHSLKFCLLISLVYVTCDASDKFNYIDYDNDELMGVGIGIDYRKGFPFFIDF